VALLAGLATPGRKDSVAGAYIFALATVGLAVILYLAYASFFILKTGCVLCIGTYVSVIGIFIAGGTAASVPLSRLPLRVFGDVRQSLSNPVAFIAAILLLAATGSAIAFFPKEATTPAQAAATSTAPSGDARENFASAWAQQPRVDLGIPADGAKVIIVKFNDYECGACRQAHELYKPALAKFAASHPGAVKYVVKDYPWDMSCNFNSSQTIRGHEAACYAAGAARMARDRGKFEEMETWLFANQGATPAAVRDITAKMLDVKDFDKEYALKLPDIRRDIADGGALLVNGTPTFYINGVKLPGGLIPPAYFELAIELELKKAAG
jgi:protein-disulfide isomerase